LEAASQEGLDGYQPDDIPLVVNPSYARPYERPVEEYTVGGRRAELRPLFVFPPEGRRILTDRSFPWLLTGKLINSDGENGSGAIVGGRVLLTAKHNAPDRSIAQGSWWIKFVPHFFDGAEPFGVSFVSTIRRPTPTAPHFDMMVCRLFEPLGQRLGSFGAQAWDDDWDDQHKFAAVGYPGLFGGGRPFFQTGCSADDFDSEKDAVLVRTLADLTPGDSGGPFWTFVRKADGSLDPRIVGVIAFEGTINSTRANWLTSGGRLTSLVRSARNDWPV
jgi:hypothetical protein